MEVCLRVRIDIDKNPVAKKEPTVYKVYKQDVIQTISRYKEKGYQRITRADITKFCSNFSASITMLKPTRIEELDVPPNQRYTYDHDRTACIAIAEIELNTHLRDDTELTLTKSKVFNYVVETAKDMLERLSPDIEFVIVKDHLTKTITAKIPIEQSIKLIDYCSQIHLTEKYIVTDAGYQMYLSNFRLSRYRFYLDGILLSERYYPNISNHQQLEENIFLKIEPGMHDIHIDNFGKQQILITDVAVHDTIINNINADTCSFEIR